MENAFKENALALVDGHVFIKDLDTNETLLDKHNAINFENFALAIAKLLGGVQSGTQSFQITKLAFGNGGTIIDNTGAIEYRTPKTDTAVGGLYNETYVKIVDITDPNNDDITTNKTEVLEFSGYPYSDIVVSATLDYNQPAGQETLDNNTSINGDFAFDEIGLITDSGIYLSHIVFHPIEKSANRKIQVIYTLRIRAGS
jgi:hypothetical protein